MSIETIQTQQEAFRQRLGVDATYPIVGNFTSIDGISLLLQDIQLLLLTIPGERVARPTFGCELRNQIWENINEGASAGKASILEALNTHEPRINVTAVDVVEKNYNTGLIIFRITFVILQTDTVTNLIFPFRNSQELAGQ